MILIDFHTHLGKGRDGGSLTPRQLLREMRSCAIRYSVVFPIDEPDCGPSYRVSNGRMARLVSRSRRLIGFMRLDPLAGKTALRELQRGVLLGLKGVKLHPRSEGFTPREAEFLFPEIERLRLPVIFHCSHDPGSTPAEWKRLIHKFANVPFIMAHAGKDHFEEAARLARSRPNLFLETSTQSYFRTRQILRLCGPRKILFGSDFPYSHPALERRKYELAASARERDWIFRKNAVRVAVRWHFFKKLLS